MSAKIILAQTILYLFTLQYLSGQTSSCCLSVEKSGSESYLSGELYVPAMPVDIATYFNQDWLLGDILLATGEVVRNKFIKYNGLLDELFWLEPGSKNIIKLDKDAIQQFHYSNYMGDTSVYFRKIKIKQSANSDSAGIFVQIIYIGNLSLFISHTFYIDRRELVYNKGIILEKEIFREKPVYYFISVNTKTFITMSLSPKRLYEFCPGNNEKIREFFKTNRFGKNFKNSDLVRLTQFLGTLHDTKDSF
jgi:hypothetical protein